MASSSAGPRRSSHSQHLRDSAAAPAVVIDAKGHSSSALQSNAAAAHNQAVQQAAEAAQAQEQQQQQQSGSEPAAAAVAPTQGEGGAAAAAASPAPSASAAADAGAGSASAPPSGSGGPALTVLAAPATTIAAKASGPSKPSSSKTSTSRSKSSSAARGKPSGSKSSTGSSGGSTSSTSGGSNPLLLAVPLVAAAVAGGVWFVRRMLRNQQQPHGSKPKQKSKQHGSKHAQQQEAAPAVEQSVEVVEVVEPDSLPVLVCEVTGLVPPPAPPAPLAPPPLTNLTFVVSEDVDVAGVQTTYGVSQWQEAAAPAAAAEAADALAPLLPTPTDSAPAVKRAVAAGAACVGKAAMQAAALDLVGANFGNPLNKTRVAGGGYTGAVAAVATGQAHFALAPDAVGELRVPAASCGLVAYRPTPGTCGGVSGGSGIGCLDVLGVAAADLGVLMKVAEAMGAPGSPNLRGEIIKFVVAQDLFDLCAPETHPGILAVKKALLKWAGADQAGAVQMVRFMESNTSAWESILAPPAPPAAAAAAGVDAQVPLSEFLEAAVHAGEALRRQELHARVGAVDKQAAAAAAAAAAPAAPEGAAAGGEKPEEQAEGQAAGGEQQQPAAAEGQEQQPADAASDAGAAAGEGEAPAPAAAEGQPEPAEAAVAAEGQEEAGPEAPGAADASAAAEPAAADPAADAAAAAEAALRVLPPAVAAEQLALARELSQEMFETLRLTVKSDTIVVLPALPFPPPKRNAPQVEKDMFVKLSRAFNCFASLSSCPTVTIPIGALRDGTPLAISLMAVHRFDMRLLAVAQKLSPMIRESFEAVKLELTGMARQQAAAAASGSAAAGAGGAKGSKAGEAAAAAAAAAARADPKKVEKAEKHKAKGNEFYSAGKFSEAFTEYTKAINTHAGSAVYFSNRAIACIKLFRFEQAEEDCNRALQFDLSEKDKVKALLRRATARDALQKYDEAEKDLKLVLALEPNNKMARENLTSLRQHKAEMQEAQMRMVMQMRAQQAAAAAAAASGGASAGGAAAAPAMQMPGGMGDGMAGLGGMLPPGFDPAAFMAASGYGGYGYGGAEGDDGQY